MQFVAFNARCPFEIGDTVKLRSRMSQVITDISCTHYVKSGEIRFLFELDNSGTFVDLLHYDIIPPIDHHIDVKYNVVADT